MSQRFSFQIQIEAMPLFTQAAEEAAESLEGSPSQAELFKEICRSYVGEPKNNHERATLHRLKEVKYPVLYVQGGMSCHIPCMDDGKITSICYSTADDWLLKSLEQYTRKREPCFCQRCRYELKNGELDVEWHIPDLKSMLLQIEQTGLENSDMSGVEMSEVGNNE